MEGSDLAGGQDFEIKRKIVRAAKKFGGDSSPCTSKQKVANFSKVLHEIVC